MDPRWGRVIHQTLPSLPSLVPPTQEGSGNQTRLDLVSQATPTSAKEGKGPVNCAYKPCPVALYGVAQSCYSIFSHDTLHHCLSSNNGAENGDRELGATIGAVKIL